MSNPYDPPRAPVADIELPIVTVPRPRIVTIALAILWIMLVLRALGSVGSILKMADVGSPDSWGYIAYLSVLLVVPGFLFVKIAHGRDWARIAAAALYGVDLMFRLYLMFFERMTAQFLVGLLMSTGIPAIGFLLLYLPASNAWFRSKRVTA